jgi:hypothetical protein
MRWPALIREVGRVVVNHAGDKPWTEPRQRVLLQAAPKELKSIRAFRFLVAILR